MFHYCREAPQDLGLQDYILNRKSVLREFCISNSQIDSLGWCYVETKAQADRLFRTAIERFL